jgi:hypothetical protein
MSKEYSCKQLINGEICGETNPEKFIKGRYTACIDCKNKYHKDYHKKVILNKEVERNMTIVERINENRGDLGKNVYDIVVDVFHTYPLKGVGISIPEKLKEYEDEMKRFITKMSIISQGMEKKINQLIDENSRLKEEKNIFKKESEDLKISLDQLSEKYTSILHKIDFKI